MSLTRPVVVVDLMEEEEGVCCGGDRKKKLVIIDLEHEEERDDVVLNRIEEEEEHDELFLTNKLKECFEKVETKRRKPRSDKGKPRSGKGKPRGDKDKPRKARGDKKKRGSGVEARGGKKERRVKDRSRPERPPKNKGWLGVKTKSLFKVERYVPMEVEEDCEPMEAIVLPGTYSPFSEYEKAKVCDYGGCIGRCGAIVKRILADSSIQRCLFPNVPLKQLYKRTNMQWLTKAYNEGAMRFLKEAEKLCVRYADFDLEVFIHARMDEMEERRVHALKTAEQRELFDFFVMMYNKNSCTSGP